MNSPLIGNGHCDCCYPLAAVSTDELEGLNKAGALAPLIDTGKIADNHFD